MAKICGKCGGSGIWAPPRVGLFTNSYPCKYCQGTGSDLRWGEKSCKGCFSTIEYRHDWTNVPDYCEFCRRPLEKSCKGCNAPITYKRYWTNVPDYCEYCRKWHSKSCKGCGTQIQYKKFWTNIPEHCEACRKWHQKTCKGCSAQIRYKVYWENVPDYCEDCREWKYKSCRGERCSNQVKYKKFWEHIPEYCPSCLEAKKRYQKQGYQGILHGQKVTANYCRDNRYQGCYYVSVGEGNDHVTFILDSQTGAIRNISARGPAKEMLNDMTQTIVSVLLSQLK